MILQYESVIVICFLSALIALFLGMLCRSFKSIGPFSFLLARRGAAPFIGGGDSSVDAVWGAESLLLQKIQRMAIEALLYCRFVCRGGGRVFPGKEIGSARNMGWERRSGLDTPASCRLL